MLVNNIILPIKNYNLNNKNLIKIIKSLEKEKDE